MEGSLVVNENKKWFNKKYRDAYIASKMKGVEKKADNLEKGLETIDFKDLVNFLNISFGNLLSLIIHIFFTPGNFFFINHPVSKRLLYQGFVFQKAIS